MAEVSLDGLNIELPHGLPLDEATKRIETAAHDLKNGLLKRTEPSLTILAPGKMKLAGAKANGSQFSAEITVDAKRVLVAVNGKLVLSMVEYIGGGRTNGIRGRVQAEVERALRERLVA